LVAEGEQVPAAGAEMFDPQGELLADAGDRL
jgi:hypothetical protein